MGWFDFLGRIFHPPVFVVRIEEGTARCVRGTVPAGFLNDCAEVACAFGLSSGRITGVASSRGVSLTFSSSIPEEAHQRFKNVFGLYRMRVKT